MFSGLLITFKSLQWMKLRPIRSAVATEVLSEYYQFINVPVCVVRRFVRLWPSLIIGKYKNSFSLLF